jgi:hypothetical protein
MSPADEGRIERLESEAETVVRQKFLAEFRDAVSLRTVLLVVGVLFLQLGFILSYVGAFHSPRPVRIPLGVVAPAGVAAKVAAELNKIPSDPVRAIVVPGTSEARRRIEDTTLSGALVVDATSKTDTLLVASADGSSIVTAVEVVIREAESSLHRSVSVVDVVPLQAGDGRGLTGFYLVTGWIVGGYLVAALLGISSGARPATLRRCIFRLLAVVPYAVLSGVGGALIVGPVLGALNGHLFALWGLGALLVFAASAVTMAFQTLFGVIGIGTYQAALLPPFWRALSGALPNGAGVDSVRRIVYFGARGIGGDLGVIALYVVGGVVVAALVARRGERRHAPSSSPPS